MYSFIKHIKVHRVVGLVCVCGGGGGGTKMYARILWITVIH